MDFETALTVGELKEILDGYGDHVEVVVENGDERFFNVEVADDGSGKVIIRAGLPVDA